jgi:hypothetical protein
VVPHWNNREGGEELDTSHSYMGRERFERLHGMLPSDVDVLGVDEHTAVFLDFRSRLALVLGRGGMTWVTTSGTQRFEAGSSVGLDTLGLTRLPSPEDGIPAHVWEVAQRTIDSSEDAVAPPPSPEVEALVAERSVARTRGDWSAADQLRAQITAAGWNVRDTPDGPELIPL